MGNKNFQPVFINLSNRPSKRWTEDQREAARIEVAGGDIVDFLFPKIPAGADVGAIIELALDVYNDIIDKYGEHNVVMVKGESTFVHAFVEICQEMNTLDCVATCSDRIVVNHGDGKKTVEFKFVQFRSYPNF